jgi:hypothetical protein
MLHLKTFARVACCFLYLIIKGEFGVKPGLSDSSKNLLATSILDCRRITLGKFLPHDPQILGATVPNVVSWDL